MASCPASAIIVPAASVMGLSVMPAMVATMTPVIAMAITIVMHSVAVVPRSRTAVTTWTPVISVPVPVARVAVAVIDVVVVENTEARAPVIIMIVIMMPVVRVTPVAVVINVQVISRPANGERRRNTPEKARSEGITGGVGIVIKWIRLRVIVIDGLRLINNNAFGFVIRNVDYFLVRRLDFNDAVLVADGLVFITLQISGRVSSVTKCLNGCNHVRLLCNNGLAQSPGPVDVFVHEFNDFRIIQECRNGIVPVPIGLQGWVGFKPLEKTCRLHDLQWIGRRRQNDREEVVRIKCDRADEILEVGR